LKNDKRTVTRKLSKSLLTLAAEKLQLRILSSCIAPSSCTLNSHRSGGEELHQRKFAPGNHKFFRLLSLKTTNGLKHNTVSKEKLKLTQVVERNAATFHSKRKTLTFVLAVLFRVNLEKFQTFFMLKIAIALLTAH
jgi:ribosomal protein S8E